ncbi:MAG: response regulator [Candidatus Omnitrophica bacterium]|nr:response regulator [Candidatus Omnitrophota bacterium]
MIVDDNKVLLKELQETLDLNMPGLSGFDVADRLKQNKETSGIPIIAISGYFPIDKRGILLEKRSMDRVIKKPFEIAELIMEIETVLNKTGVVPA